jgi:hypothetical protein
MATPTTPVRPPFPPFTRDNELQLVVKEKTSEELRISNVGML